jgi:hypothetical protein
MLWSRLDRLRAYQAMGGFVNNREEQQEGRDDRQGHRQRQLEDMVMGGGQWSERRQRNKFDSAVR